MKHVEDRPFADLQVAARKLIELAASIDAVQDGRVHIEKINAPFLIRTFLRVNPKRDELENLFKLFGPRCYLLAGHTPRFSMRTPPTDTAFRSRVLIARQTATALENVMLFRASNHKGANVGLCALISAQREYCRFDPERPLNQKRAAVTGGPFRRYPDLSISILC